jgi:TRAP-type C4-dicarboxylate transport system substrate-binding protein
MAFKPPASLLAAALALATVTLPHTARSAEFVLRFASISAEPTATYQQVYKPFAEAVAKDSNGRIEVALKPLGGYGKPADLFNMVEHRDIEMAVTVQGYSPGRFPQSSVMELPLMSESAVSGTRAMMTMLKEGDFDKDYASVRVLGLTVLPPYGIFTTGRKMEQLKDLRGLRVRTPSPTVGLALLRMGMIPLGVPVNLVGEAIASGTVDAITFGWDSLTTAPGTSGKMLSDQVSVLIDANFAAPAMMLLMNKATWESIPADLQMMIEKNGAQMVADGAKLRQASETVTRDRLKTDPRYSYIALTDAQHAQIEHLIQPAVTDWKQNMTRLGLDGDRLYDRARELVRQSSVAER